MSLVNHIEENAEHLFKLVKHMMAVEQNMYGVVHEATQKLHDAFEAHISSPVVAAPVVVSAPSDTNVITMSVTPATVPIEAPQTVTQEQSASNKAN